MTILEGDIKLLASRIMDDGDEGGGGPSAHEVPYGQSNGVFLDVTEADRAGGNVSIRQLHMAVMTPTAEQFMGANIILALPPTDPNVSITLAKCDLFHRRSDIARAIANYLIEGTQWSGYLLEDHVAGMMSIQILHRPGTPAPDIGRTLVLTKNVGLPTEFTQFVRVTRTETTDRTFTYSESGSFVDFQASVTKVDLSDRLRAAFPGSPPSRTFGPAAGKTTLRDTTVADAATYYGASPLVVAAALEDTSVKVASIYTQLVPSSRTETTALDQRPAAERTLVLAEAPRRVEVPVAAHTRRIKINQSNRGFSFVAMLKPLPEPGTVVISYQVFGRWYTLADDGAGALAGAGAGRVIYTTGSLEMTLQAMPDDGSSIIIQHAGRVAYTNRSAQGAQVAPPTQALQLARKGAVPGTVTVQWLSGGVLRTATDSSGGFTGAATGVIDYPSSSLILRPQYMIDPGGTYTVTYDAGGQVEEIIAAPALDPTGSATIVLAQTPLAGSISVAWSTAQEVSQTSGATLSESAVVKSFEEVQYRMPIIMHTVGGVIEMGTGIRKVGTTATWTKASQKDGTTSSRIITQHVATDDGAGGFASTLGAVVYASKTILLKLISHDRSTSSWRTDHDDAHTFEEATYTGGTTEDGSKGGEYGTAAVGEEQLGTVIVRYKVAPLVSTAATEEFTPDEVVIDLCPYTTDSVVPGSVLFAWMGRTYQDFEGTIYRDRTAGLPGTASGTVDYAAGVARMTDYVVAGDAGSFVLSSLWTARQAWNTGSIFFRTQAAPIKPGGLVLTVTDTRGNALAAMAGLDGNFVGEHTHGRMDFESGVGELQFGDFVLDASLTPEEKLEWWYSADDVGAVQAGKIWRPWPVDPTTLRYNSVAYFYLPLDADILGLDPVRLPPDGRVPMYRVGSYVVIGHTGRVPAAVYADGDVVDCGRERLSRVHLVDATGALIHTGYSVDLDTGMVTITDRSTWVQPVTIKHRIEEMARVSDVGIDGTLKLTKRLSHVFPLGSYVSSAIMSGNLRARALPVFDQGSWDGVTWSDVAVGSPAAATYNDGAFPVVVTNAGAMTERFALRVLSGGTDVEVIGEHVGNLGSFSRNTAIAPINPVSGAPYFTLPAAGWGAGWVPGNTLFLPTIGTYYPFAAIRTIQPSEAAGTDYAFELLERGDVDRAPTAPII